LYIFSDNNPKSILLFGQSHLLDVKHLVSAKYKSVALAFLFISSFTKISAQWEINYTPIEVKGEIPPRFYQTLQEDTPINITLKEEHIKKKRRKEFETKSDFTLREIFVSGSIYYNDPCTRYVREVAARLLSPLESKPKISVSVSRFITPNAAIWQDGTLIVNIGLLAQLENEAQLAFVLAHEIGHYQYSHPLKQYIRTQNPSSIQKRALDNLKADLDYTQDREEEADAFALKLLDKAGYDSREAQKALSVLTNHTHKCETLFESLFIDRADECGELEVQHYKNMKQSLARHFAPTMLLQRKEKISHTGSLHDGIYLVSQNNFEEIKGIAQFELIENAYHQADDVSALYHAAVLKKKYPENAYLHAKIAESLYRLYFYKKRGMIDQVLQLNRENHPETEILRLSCFLYQANEATLQKLTETYLKSLYEYSGNNETVVITMAKYMELTFGREQAKEFFNYYIKHFPQGKHYRYAEARVSSE